MGLLDRVVSGLFGRGESVADSRQLADFMDSRAAFICQKCVVEFCRVRAGVYWQKLFAEEEFRERLTQSCWESYPPALAMVAEMVEAVLRPHAGLAQRRLPEALMAVCRDVVARHPLPAGAPDTFWTDGLTYVAERLEATQSGPPRPVRNMTKPSARRIFEALPLHQEIVTHDFDYIRNNLRMNLLRFHDDFVGMARVETLVPNLLERAG